MKKIFMILLILILLPIVAMAIFLLTFDLNHYRHLTEEELTKSLRYPVEIGSMETKLSLIPTIRITNFKVLTNEKDKIILNVPSMDATIELAPLIKKRVVIQAVELPMVSIDLTNIKKLEKPDEVKKEDVKKDAAPAKKDLSNLLWVENIKIEKMFLFFQKEQAKSSFSIENFNIKKLANFETKFTYLNNSFNVNGSFGTLTDFLGQKNNLPIDLKIKNDTNTINLKGQIGDLAQMSKIRLDVNANFPKLADFLVSLGVNKIEPLDTNATIKFSVEGNLDKLSLKKIDTSAGKKALAISGEGTLENIKESPELSLKLTTKLSESDFSKKLKLNPFEITNQLNFSDRKLKIEELKYQANKTDLTGSVIVDLSQKPTHIKLNLNSFYFSLKDMFYQQLQPQAVQPDSGDKQKETQHIIPDIALPWTTLKSCDLDGQIQVMNLKISDNIEEYASVNMRPTLTKGILTSPIQMRFITGTLNNILRLNANDQTIQLKSEAKNLNLDKVRNLNKSLKNASLFADMSIQTKGPAIKELLSNSDGNITIEIVGGKIIDSWFNDLSEILNNSKVKTAFTTTQKETDILCGAINLSLNKGVLTSQDQVVLQTGILNLVLNGQVDLNKETLKVSILPSRPDASDKAALLTDMVQMITLSGPWTDIQLGLDAQKVVSDLINKGVEMLAGTQKKSATYLCEQALGRAITPPTNKTKVEVKTAPINETPKQKVDLKDQLLKSLSQLLLKKGS